MKTLVSIILFSIFYCAASAQAILNSGTVELGGQIMFSSTTENANGNYSDPNIFSSGPTYNILGLDPYIGFMTGGGLELGIKAQLALGPASEVSFAGYFNPSYNFRTNSIVIPYVGALAGYGTIKTGEGELSSANGFGYGFGAGIKIMVGSKSLVLIEVQYIHQQYNYAVDGNFYYNYYYGYQPPTTLTVNESVVNFGVGFRLFFGGSAGRQAKVSTPRE